MIQANPSNQVLTPAQHLALHSAAQQLQSSLAPPSSATIPLIHRGNTFTSLPASLHDPLYALLMAHCHTPTRLALEDFPLPSPPPPPDSNPSITTTAPKALAIVLDCELAGTGSSRADDEIIMLSVIDFFTGATLLHTLVCPDRPVTDWRTAITGVTAEGMAAAVSGGEALRGRDGAVAALWGVVSCDTVVVGHAVEHDLRALGVGFGRVVDSAVLAAEASGLFADGKKIWGQAVGLEKLCRELVGVRIREGQGAGTHDSLEDVLATREVVVWCLRHPEELKLWAAKIWKPKKKGAGKGRRTGRGGGRWRGRAKKGRAKQVYQGEQDDDSDEVLRWEDVVDYDMWPKSPPDWSD